jgi:hypothetical protein
MVMIREKGAEPYPDEQTERHHPHLITTEGAAYS